MPDTLHEAEEQVISYSSEQTPRQQENQTIEDKTEKGKEQEQGVTGKRPREDQSPGIDTYMREFKLKYKKNPRKHMDIDKGLLHQTVTNIINIPNSSPNMG